MNRQVCINFIIIRNQQQIEQFSAQIDTNTPLGEIFLFVQDNYKIPEDKGQWTCFSKEKNCYLTNLNSTLESDQSLIINVGGEIKNVGIEVKNKIKLVQPQINKVNLKIVVVQGIQTLLENRVELEPQTTLQQLYNMISKQISFQGSTSNWTCYSSLTQKQLQEQTIGIQYQNDTFKIQTWGQAPKLQVSSFMKPQWGNQIRVKLTIQRNTELVAEKTVNLDITAILQQVFDYVRSSMGIVGNHSLWTCFSQSRAQFLTDRLMRIGGDDTLIINIGDDIKFYSAIISARECLIHRNQQTQSICIATHKCQRRLCFLCEHDDLHQNLKKTETLPLPIAMDQLQAKVKPLITQQQQCDHLIKKALLIKESVITSIDQYIKNLEEISQQYTNSFVKAQELLKYIEQCNIFENTNTFIEEIVEILNTNRMESQLLISKINYQTIENNVNCLENLSKQFQEHIASLKYEKIEQNQCQINIAAQFIQYQNYSFSNGFQNNKNFFIETAESNPRSMCFTVFKKNELTIQ